MACRTFGQTACVTLALFTTAATTAVTADSIFVDATAEVGLDFKHVNGMVGEYHYIEMVGAGGAVLDFDRDGDLDVYAVQGGPFRGGEPLSDRLYRNDVTVDADGRRRQRFVDVTAAAGIRATGYGMGVAVGDVDGDGWPDLYVTNYGANQLWHNDGDGTFSDVTAASGTGDPGWGTSAAFLDYDGDGDPDLFVANYVDYSVQGNPSCFAASSRRDYCGPSNFPPQRDRLYRNRGDGTFDDVTDRALGEHRPGAGLGVAVADFDRDGRPDLYVANDGAANHLWLNRGDGTFVDDALLAGTALNREGRAEASMGVDAGDVDNDGDEDLFLTHLMGETNTLYVNDGSGLFEDRTAEFGLAVASAPYTAFGTAWLDYDNDGWLDLLTLNGAVRILEPLAAAGDPYPLHQPNQLFRNLGGTRFAEASAAAGPVLALSEVSRGAAFADLDDDGDSDVLLFNNHGPLRLLRNEVGNQNPWLGIDPRDAAGRPLAGTRVEVVLDDGRRLWRRARRDGSYCSSNDPRVLVGLGAGRRAERVVLHWPDGDREELTAPAMGRYTTLRRTESPKTP